MSWKFLLRSAVMIVTSSAIAMLATAKYQMSERAYMELVEKEAKNRNFPEMLKWLQEAVDLGYPEAQFVLGHVLFNGRDLKQNKPEALELYRKSAIQGNVKAQTALFWVYSNEHTGVPQDFKEALRWLRIMADEGHAEAQLTLGDWYHDGKAIRPDDQLAVRWYRRAAAQGNPNALLKLANSYQMGTGVERNPIESYALEDLAAAAGNRRASGFNTWTANGDEGQKFRERVRVRIQELKAELDAEKREMERSIESR